VSAEALRAGGVAFAGRRISGAPPRLPKRYCSVPVCAVAVREAQTDTCLPPRVGQWNTATSAVEQNEPATVGPCRVTASARTLGAGPAARTDDAVATPIVATQTAATQIGRTKRAVSTLRNGISSTSGRGGRPIISRTGARAPRPVS
jgi:hypothetical protein